MGKEKYSIRFDKKTGFYNVFLSGFTPMYCGSYNTKEEAQKHIKQQKR